MAVGEHGTILQTKDGGATWAPQTSGTLSTLLSVSFADDGQRGLAVGGDVINSFILQTKDGGATWAPQTSGTLSALSSVSFAADGEHGWAVGLDGMILQTKDGGASWALQTSGTESLLLSVNFAANGQRGWAVGEHGTVLQTKDGGATWVPQTSGTQFSLNSVSFAADGQRGWAVGEHGTILRTKDGGAAWVPQTSGTQYWLFSVSFAADGQRGWTVGEHGTILQTNDGGASWVPQTSGTQSYLYSVSFTANGQRGLAVGEHGTILQTKDGGANWAVPQTSGTQSTLLSVNFSADGQRGWAVGEQGTILQTKDGGVTWASLTSGTQSYLSSVNFSADGQRGWVVGIRTVLQTKDGGANWNSYSREPALAYFVFLALTFVPLYFAVRKPKEPPAGEGSIANAYIADTVLTAAEAAGTQVGAIAAGLASYLENPKTDAPLVIAITGPWGSGKSSLMNILRDALRAKGFQTAWFNAWHNQSEEHLFAAVLASLRSKALPHWWTRRGIRARIRLTFKRFGRMWLRLLLGLAGIVFISTVVWNLQVDLNKLLDWTSPDKVLASLAIPAALLPVIALWKVFSAFGADPTKLTKTLRGATAAEAWEATSFRERFAEEFGEVTHALQPQTLTLFIDDLDRCHPDQMLIILEAVNFLASSGSCYIVLGMEQKVLMHCLEQKLDWLQDLPAPERAPAGTSRAQLWLEKLIQLRLSVAPLSWEELQSLLSTRSERGSRVKRPPTSDLERLGLCVPGFLRTVGMALALVALGGAVGSGAWQLGQSFVRHSKPTAEEKTEKPPAWFSEVELAGKLNNTDVILRMQPKTGYQNPAVSTGKQDVNPDLGGKQSALDKVPEEIGPVMIQPGQNATPNLTWIIVLMLIVLVLIVLWGALKVLTMRYLSSIDDSKTFTSTLKDFIPCINAACQTPRAVKHLINGVRLYAMLLRHWSLDPKNVEDASTRLELGQEADLVIYGILEKLCPDQLRAALLQPNEAAFTLESIDPKLSVFNNRAARAIRSLTAYNSREDFERLVRSIEIK